MKTKKKYKGFTLVELLVVISIIAILAGLLLPVIGNVMKKGMITNNNNNNLRQLGLALAMYSAPEQYGRMPVWNGGVDDGEGDPGDDTELELVTALGRLYDGGDGLVGDWRVFSCPGKPCEAPDTEGPQIDGNDDINHDKETSFSLTRAASTGDPINKIILADEGDGEGKGKFNWDDGQCCLYKDTHIEFEKEDDPNHDSDDNSIYEEGDKTKKDTIMF